MLAFIDIETTGIDPEKDQILEVACVLLDDELNEVGRFERVTTGARHKKLNDVDERVLKMYADNGLWNASLVAPSRIYTPEKDISGCELAYVDQDLHSFLCNHCYEKPGDPNPLHAGNLLFLDRLFIEHHMKQTNRCLSYTGIDVQTFHETAERFFPDIFEHRVLSNNTHRAMADVLTNVANYKYYVREFKRLKGQD